MSTTLLVFGVAASKFDNLYRRIWHINIPRNLACRTEIKDVYQQYGEDDINLEIASSVIQLIFHDCVGSHSSSNLISICDGCVDIHNIHDQNHGNLYENSIAPLESIYLHSNLSLYSKISRADFWSLAASYSLVLKKENSPAAAPMDEIPYYFGRKDCETSPNINKSSITRYKTLPHPSDSWDKSYSFLAENLNFSIKDAIAMIGLHTIGNTHVDGFGIHSSWTDTPGKLVHTYFLNIYNKLYRQTGITSLAGNGNSTKYWIPVRSQQNLALNVDMGMYYNIDEDVSDELDDCQSNQTLSDCVGYNRIHQNILNYSQRIIMSG